MLKVSRFLYNAIFIRKILLSLLPTSYMSLIALASKYSSLRVYGIGVGDAIPRIGFFFRENRMLKIISRKFYFIFFLQELTRQWIINYLHIWLATLDMNDLKKFFMCLNILYWKVIFAPTHLYGTIFNVSRIKTPTLKNAATYYIFIYQETTN